MRRFTSPDFIHAYDDHEIYPNYPKSAGYGAAESDRPAAFGHGRHCSGESDLPSVPDVSAIARNSDSEKDDGASDNDSALGIDSWVE